MGVLSVVEACAHLQNAQRARLGLTSVPNTKSNLLFALALHRAGLISSLTRAGPTPPPADQLLTFETEPVTSANVATRRLWLGLKYVNNEPLMLHLSPITTPKRPVNVQLRSLHRIARGFEAPPIDGLKMGECLFLATSQGVLEVQEALERQTGGLCLARVSSY